jgi:hypothetical protein
LRKKSPAENNNCNRGSGRKLINKGCALHTVEARLGNNKLNPNRGCGAHKNKGAARKWKTGQWPTLNYVAACIAAKGRKEGMAEGRTGRNLHKI